MVGRGGVRSQPFGDLFGGQEPHKAISAPGLAFNTLHGSSLLVKVIHDLPGLHLRPGMLFSGMNFINQTLVSSQGLPLPTGLRSAVPECLSAPASSLSL